MIDWMSKKCDRLMDKYHVCAYGFDSEKDGDDAKVYIELRGCDIGEPVRLGAIRNVPFDTIERRFAAGVFAIGVRRGLDVLVEFADRMLDPYDDGELEYPIPF